MILYQLTAFAEKHKEALRRHATLHYRCVFPTPPACNEGQAVSFRLFAGRKPLAARAGVTHSFLSAAVTSAAALGKRICDPEEKALQGEACLINRIVPVWFTLLAGVTLDEAAGTEVC